MVSFGYYLVLISCKGTVFDVSGNKAYGPEGGYKGIQCLRFAVVVVSADALVVQVFAGKDASRALAQSSLDAEEARPDWQDLPDKDKKVLDDWYTYFSKRLQHQGQG